MKVEGIVRHFRSHAVLLGDSGVAKVGHMPHQKYQKNFFSKIWK